jgi:type II secretory ATPase GspE/PulE/Tfp pilus assembly ATPase PilB-like protein
MAIRANAAERTNDGTPLANEDQSPLQVEKRSIDRSLWEHFAPELYSKQFIMPVEVDKGESDEPLSKQTWRLKLAVEKSAVNDVKKCLDFLAEQIQMGSPEFWPGKLEIEVLPTLRDQIVPRLKMMRQSWDMRVMNTGLVLPPASGPIPEPAPSSESPVASATRLLQAHFAERTQQFDTQAMISGVTRSDQVIDLRVDDRAPSRKALQQLLHVAIMKGASDIHIEHVTDGIEPPHVAIRLRIDGVMQPLVESKHFLGPQILKILGTAAGAGVEESAFHMRPQDGKFIVYTKDNRRLDGRLAFVPVPVTSSSFNCSIRLLDSSKKFDFSKLDLSKRNDAILREGMQLDHGMIVLTGPTGSGKSSTIQACLRHIITPEVKVITIEDPVEYFLKGAEQTQVSHKDSAMSFANLLRSALRRDPDIVFLGEIRDSETAKTAVEAALTGHLLFTTIHANSALAVVDRLIDLGVHPDLVASALAVVGAQRLVRRVAPERWERDQYTYGELSDRFGLKLAKDDEDRKKTMPGLRLKADFEPGHVDNYQGRIGVHEFQNFDEELKDAIRSGARGSKLWALARQRGLRTLMEDGIAKAQQGQTSFEDLALNLKGT